MRCLALITLLVMTALPAAADECVTTSLRMFYFGLDEPDRALAITENLRPPDDDMAAEPAPAPPPPAAPGGGGLAGGIPDCAPIVRPADDAVAKQICAQATTYGLWTCHTDATGNIVIEDVRYLTPAQP